jgi:hypothetical protein
MCDGGKVTGWLKVLVELIAGLNGARRHVHSDKTGPMSDEIEGRMLIPQNPREFSLSGRCFGSPLGAPFRIGRAHLVTVL